jgi:hypothetical protein
MRTCIILLGPPCPNLSKYLQERKIFRIQIELKAMTQILRPMYFLLKSHNLESIDALD